MQVRKIDRDGGRFLDAAVPAGKAAASPVPAVTGGRRGAGRRGLALRLRRGVIGGRGRREIGHRQHVLPFKGDGEGKAEMVVDDPFDVPADVGVFQNLPAAVFERNVEGVPLHLGFRPFKKAVDDRIDRLQLLDDRREKIGRKEARQIFHLDFEDAQPRRPQNGRLTVPNRFSPDIFLAFDLGADLLGLLIGGQREDLGGIEEGQKRFGKVFAENGEEIASGQVFSILSHVTGYDF